MKVNIKKYCWPGSHFEIRLTTLLMLLLVIQMTACKKLVNVDPPTTSTTGVSVYNSDATATAVMTGMYTVFAAAGPNSVGQLSSITMTGALSSDELTLYSGVTALQQIAYFHNALTGTSSVSFGTEYWSTLYKYIFQCNDAIQGLNASSSLTPSVKQQLLGEAKFMRATLFFYLVNLYGDVPLVITTDYKANSSLDRSTKAQVYQQIIADLKEAQGLLNSSYLDASLLKTYPERVRPTTWAATALLARVYLYYGNLTNDGSQFTNAEVQASTLINNTGLFKLSSLANTFIKFSLGNNEAIWQLQPVNSTWNTEDAKSFVVPATGPMTVSNIGILASNYLLNSFEPGDNRKTNWIGSTTVSGTTYYFPAKYKINMPNQPVNEYLTVFRLGEQYLIRAEARAQLGESNTVNDLNAIRNRAGLPNYSGMTDKASLLAAILHERQVELFAEFGHRWLDLKRTGTADAVMGTGGVCAAKGGTWSSNWALYPLPLTDLQLDANLKQNAGY